MTIVRTHLFAFALVVLITLVVHGNAAQFRIAVALPLTGSMQTVAVGAREVLDASLDDVNQWARSTGSNHSFSLQVIDTEGRLSTGVKSVFDAARGNAVGVIGEYSSSITIPMALAGNNFPLWQCSGSATSPDLSNKTTFPWFFRALPADSAQGVMMAKFVKLMQWKNVAILFASDAYGTGIMSTFSAESQRLNINIATSQSFTSGDETSYALALEAVQNAGTRVVMFMGTYPDYIPMARQARKRGMINDDWVYIGSEGVGSIVEELKKPEYSATDRENVNGLLFTFPLERGPAAKDFINNVYRRRFPQRSDVQSYALFYAECLATMARGLVRLAGSIGETAVVERRYPSTINLQSLLTSYTGITGAVNYDQNGDRVSDFAVMNVFNMQVQQAWTLPVSSEQVVSVTAPRFFSGTSKVPSDVPAFMLGYVTYASIGGILLLGLLGIVAFGIVATIVFLYIKRNTVAVKNMSLVFLVIISFGLLLVVGAQSLWLDVPTAMTCNLQAVLLLVGLELVLASVAAKAYRIFVIFDNRTLRKLDSMSNARLIMGCMVIVSVQGALLLGWIMMSPLQPVLVASTSAISYECRSPNATVEMVFKTSSLIYNGILLIVLSVLAYKTRKAYSAFRESVFISYSVQNIFLCGVVVAPFLYLSRKDFALAAFFIKFSAVLYWEIHNGNVQDACIGPVEEYIASFAEIPVGDNFSVNE
ncbi:periplasmic binding protein-like I [Catenaria anguillulae PL171]|uniref:Periplasmic binding protein-like I n=1 Tax=Catenaria anguillulae PL171 TaxID=765915 RepID=A0A1Y2HL81_9FUNG|nr:periplasmic binding protein-like I [Catenaria anguillulae PL171]